MTLFEMPDDGDEREYQGKYAGKDPTPTEAESGAKIEKKRRGPIKPGGPEHLILLVYADGSRMTAYDASFRAVGDYHSKRRESERLWTRGFLVKDGELPNRAPGGRPHVDAFKINDAGKVELLRLGR